MLIRNKFNGYSADGRRCYNVGGGVGEAALISAAIGGGAAALQGGDPLKGALLGGALGGIGGGLAGGASGAMPGAAEAAAGSAGAGAGAASAAPWAQTASGLNVLASETPGLAASTTATPWAQTASGLNVLKAETPGLTQAAKTSFFDSPTAWWSGLSNKEKLLYGGGAGLGLMTLMDRQRYGVPGQAPYTGPLSRFNYNPDVYRPTLQMADGGIANIGKQNMLVGGGPPRTAPLGIDGGLDWQRRSEAVTRMASGGISNLGTYSDGGRLLRGPGDGMSDNIPATIANKQPARLADGEFVVPADVVSHLGNGSTDAGARKLYSMMDKVRHARTGNKKQGREINPEKYLPA